MSQDLESERNPKSIESEGTPLHQQSFDDGKGSIRFLKEFLSPLALPLKLALNIITKSFVEFPPEAAQRDKSSL